jgi:hypothetical protein
MGLRLLADQKRGVGTSSSEGHFRRSNVIMKIVSALTAFVSTSSQPDSQGVLLFCVSAFESWCRYADA